MRELDNIRDVTEPRVEFERMFRRHHTAVFRFAMRRVETSAVHDVVAETFLTAWRRFDTVDGDPLPWLLGIARRVCANHLRGRQRLATLRERLIAERPPDGGSPSAEDLGLLACLANLREEDRETLLLVAWEGLSNAQAARVVGCSPGTFAVRLHRARRRLTREWELRVASDSGVDQSDREMVTYEA